MEEEFDVSKIQTIIQPRRVARIKFQLSQEEGKFEGKVTQVGKQGGKDKNHCWVKVGEELRSFDFSKDVKEWKNVHHVHFTEGIQEKETSQEMKKREKVKDQRGTKLMFYAILEEGILEDEKRYNEVLVTEIPEKFHKSPEILPQKQK